MNEHSGLRFPHLHMAILAASNLWGRPPLVAAVAMVDITPLARAVAPIIAVIAYGYWRPRHVFCTTRDVVRDTVSVSRDLGITGASFGI